MTSAYNVSAKCNSAAVFSSLVVCCAAVS